MQVSQSSRSLFLEYKMDNNIINSGHSANLLDIAKNTGFGIFGRLFFLAIRFASVVLITRNLGSELYGVFIISISILITITVECKNVLK